MKKVLLTSAVALAAFGAVQAVSADTATFSEANVQTLPNAKPAADERTEPSAEVSKLFKEAAEAAEAAAKRGEEASGKVNTTENGDLTIDDIKSHLASQQSQQSNKQRVVTDRYVKVYDKEGNELKLDGKAVEIKYEKSANSTVEVKTKRGTYKLTVRVQNGKATLLKTPQLVASAETPAQKAEWIKSGSRWWYKHADGSYTTNGWEKINGTWYYFDQAGWMTTGWVKDNGTWYYLNDNGSMATGWYQVGGKWYYSYASGALAVNTTVDGYKVNHNGEWVK
ncbi:choline-binding protein [Streptococcus pneumoniae]|uniref:N-acetylmuramoyl-L-alanine amidase family protein n=1 Tax=Streptococcus pseudopneumoniae TaxID=257758 RepID=A0A3A4S7Q4_9STRE|nr:choline-binding protein [Streptococcus pneumoniae]PLV80367.1 choline-binding protein [Streptococcus pseudopneumoniae]PLV88334.1 choline-binding protein [Streptococcus pneumoniae]RJP79174.1 N-acetylmuramoyl-L-alanine amidase family protein [Streptococcus pseudopneumoniae]TVW58078.1 N-acetylmuramoyl-L-alanine amidase family protein [Streptococcus pneumoniae]